MTNIMDIFHYEVIAPFTHEGFPTYRITRDVPDDVPQLIGYAEHVDSGIWAMRTLDGVRQLGCSVSCREIAQRLVRVTGRVEVDHPRG